VAATECCSSRHATNQDVELPVGAAEADDQTETSAAKTAGDERDWSLLVAEIEVVDLPQLIISGWLDDFFFSFVVDCCMLHHVYRGRRGRGEL
jgi:hypothetical protein